MNIKRTIWFAIAIGILGALPSFAAQVRSQSDPNVDFCRYKTFSWQSVHATYSPLWADQIKAAVDSVLESKGWTKVEGGGDVFLVALEMTQDHRTPGSYYHEFEGGWGWRWGGGFGDESEPSTEETYTVGTLILDLFDTNSKKLIWRGSIADKLSKNSKKDTKNLNRNVLKLFDHFPQPVKASGGAGCKAEKKLRPVNAAGVHQGGYE